MRFHILILSLVICFSIFKVEAQMLPSFYGSNMVLQRNEPIMFYGTSDPQEEFTVKFAGITKEIKSDKKGNWHISYAPLQAGGPFTFSLYSLDTTTIFDNILIGDVWLCSGQSNMEYAIRGFNWSHEEYDQANNSSLRLFKVDRDFDISPRTEVSTSGWYNAEGSNIADFGATPYFFGKNLQPEAGIPIGLILSAYGGTNIEAWMTEDMFKQFPHIQKIHLEQKENIKSIEVLNPQKVEQEFAKQQVYRRFTFDSTIVHTPAEKDWNPITVPFQFSGVQALEGKKGEVWLKKEFEVPMPFYDKTLKFKLGRWDDYATFFVNGKPLYESFNKKQWVSFTVSKELLYKDRQNTLVVRLVNYSDEGGSYDDPTYYTIYPVGDKTGYYIISGAWSYLLGQEIAEDLDIPKVGSHFSKVNESPSSAFNAMIAPLLALKFKGVIWYQGESNAARAHEYQALFPEMIQGWRRKFHKPELPFLFVQLANFEKHGDVHASTWAELREAQSRALVLDQTAMITAIDIGDPRDIHPANKQEVGRRLTLAAQNLVYDANSIYQGPTMKSFKTADQKMIITFDNVGDNLVVKKDPYGYIRGFYIAGDDQVFYPAQAKINGNTVTVFTPKVKAPVAVRYAWADNPEEANLYNTEDLPAYPFRTDNWPMTTEGKKYGGQ